MTNHQELKSPTLPPHADFSLDGRAFTRLMRRHAKTIRGLAQQFDISQKRIRQLRRSGAEGFAAQELFYMCVGRWPTAADVSADAPKQPRSRQGGSICKVGRQYVTKRGDSVMGIAMRELGDESRWREIVQANSQKFGDLMRSCDYYPVGTVLLLPNIRPSGESRQASAAGKEAHSSSPAG